MNSAIIKVEKLSGQNAREKQFSHKDSHINKIR